MQKEAALNFRDQFRRARALALRDAEAFDEIIFVMERMGMLLTGKAGNLQKYKVRIITEARRSPLATKMPDACTWLHIPVIELYDLVQDGRNWAMHQGAFARHMTRHAVKMAIVLEDALMNGYYKVRDFMVQNPVCAEMWQPLSFIRQTMLENSFSFLPVNSIPDAAPAWKLVSELEVAQYLRNAGRGDRARRLVKTLREAVTPDGIRLLDPKLCRPEDSAPAALDGCKGLPVLVTHNGTGKLLGIVTAFDLL